MTQRDDTFTHVYLSKPKEHNYSPAHSKHIHKQ